MLARIKCGWRVTTIVKHLTVVAFLIGFALPGAIAESLVEPDRKIIGIAGDAGFLMNVQEMETASRLNSNITIMVWEDNAYGLIAWRHWAQFGKHTDLSFQNPDWKLLAKSFRWHYKFVNESVSLSAALESAAAHRGLSLVVVPIDYRENKTLTRRLGEITCTIWSNWGKIMDKSQEPAQAVI